MARRSWSTPIARLPLTTELFEGRRYVRLRQLRHLLDDGELEEGLRWAAHASRERVGRAVRRDPDPRRAVVELERHEDERGFFARVW